MVYLFTVAMGFLEVCPSFSCGSLQLTVQHFFVFPFMKLPSVIFLITAASLALDTWECHWWIKTKLKRAKSLIFLDTYEWQSATPYGDVDKDKTRFLSDSDKNIDKQKQMFAHTVARTGECSTVVVMICLWWMMSRASPWLISTIWSWLSSKWKSGCAFWILHAGLSTVPSFCSTSVGHLISDGPNSIYMLSSLGYVNTFNDFM